MTQDPKALADDIKQLRKFTYDGAGGNQARQAIDRLEAALRLVTADASPLRAQEPVADLYAYIPDIVKNAMLTMWNYICDDSKHHPLDIEHGRGKFLTFEPGHWAQFTGETVQRNIRDLFHSSDGSPSNASLRTQEPVAWRIRGRNVWIDGSPPTNLNPKFEIELAYGGQPVPSDVGLREPEHIIDTDDYDPEFVENILAAYVAPPENTIKNIEELIGPSDALQVREDQIEIAARAMYDFEPWNDGTTWDSMTDSSKNAFRENMRFVFAVLAQPRGGTE